MEQIQLYSTLWRECNAIYEEWAKKHGLSYSELLVVLSLAERQGVCLQKDICKQWVLPKQTVNTVLKNFVDRSFVVLSSYESDRRSKLIQLTKKGRIFVERIAGELQQIECRAWTKLGEKDAQLLLEKTSMYNRFLREEVVNEST